MKIYIAEKSGYCFGVNRAIEIAEKTVTQNKNKSIYSLGPLVHNPQVVDRFNNKGLKVIDNIEEIDELNDVKVIIRAHGVSNDAQQKILDSNFELIDGTCPYVKSVHNRVNKYYNDGYKIVIIGDKNHPEVIGINGWCNNEAIIINDEEEAKEIPNFDKICVVSQTTNTLEKFEKLSNLLLSKGNEVKVFNTICNATSERQIACADLAKNVEAMIVIGGYNSSNTNKLVDVSKKFCENVYHIETFKDLSLQTLSKFNTIGITAGASTPDWIIKEVIETLENINNDQMMEAIENTMVKIKRGDVVKGNVIYVTDNEVMVNINYKSDGIITKNELSNDPDVNPKDLFKEGDEIEVYIVSLNDGDGNVILSYKRLESVRNWEMLEEIYKNKETVECKVLTDIKGGLSVLVKGIRAFIPASQISVSYVDDLSQYNNKNLNAKIIDLDKKRNRIILSSKAIEKVELDKKKEELWDDLEVGNIIDGRVVRLTDFGAFIDIGGLDGLAHISDLSWSKVKHPSEIVNIGDEIKLIILDFDKEKNRISLGLKQISPKPWDIFIENNEIGDIIEGKVVNVLDFGAFVRLKEGVDGLIHVSQISSEYISKPSDKLKIGDIITVKIIDIDREEQKISLSIKALIKAEEDEEKETIEDEVKNYTNNDLDVKLGDLITEDK